MSEEGKETEEREDQKEDARDLEPKKDAKGGGGFGKQSPAGGGSSPDPGKPSVN